MRFQFALNFELCLYKDVGEFCSRNQTMKLMQLLNTNKMKNGPNCDSTLGMEQSRTQVLEIQSHYYYHYHQHCYYYYYHPYCYFYHFYHMCYQIISVYLYFSLYIFLFISLSKQLFIRFCLLALSVINQQYIIRQKNP